MTGHGPRAADLAARYAGRSHPARLIGEACRSAVRGEYSVGLTLGADGGHGQRVSLSAAGELAGPGESLQISLGEGPCVQALYRGGPVAVDDVEVADEARQWPVFARRAREHGIRALYALLARTGFTSDRSAAVVLTLYRDRAGPASTADLDVAQTHAAAADILLFSPPAGPSSGQGGENPDDAWLVPSHAVIHQAVGMLSYRNSISPGRALSLLRAHALARDTDPVLLAHAVVHENLDLPGPPGPSADGPPRG
ncbi:ANTAR domain-containing protein [Streptomyces sp. NPDC050703]|uniref:ANTAR domain-containing protein n=1 Tax=Streptomyces sp. NPDC050703 TaxID=3157218 RepID=UPI00342E8C78